MAELTYPIPADTASALQVGLGRCCNPGLLFDRLSPDVGAVNAKETGEIRRQALERVRGCAPDATLLDAFRTRWRATVEALSAVIFEARTEGRLVVGLGRKGPLEVGFTFHRLYGFPVIPGSALKGLARAAALLEKGGNYLDAELVAAFGREPDLRKLGDGGHAGKAIFLEAIPASRPALDLDLLNPHYPDYYRKETDTPTNWQNPSPVYFLAVRPGTPFLFAVGWRGDTDRVAQEQVVGWLRDGLGDLGVGAKTTSGYGYWAVGPVPATTQDQERETVAGAPPPELPWRRAVVRVHRSGQGGILVDAETGKEVPFGSSAPQPRGTTFKTRAEVEYRAAEREGRIEALSIRRLVER